MRNSLIVLFLLACMVGCQPAGKTGRLRMIDYQDPGHLKLVQVDDKEYIVNGNGGIVLHRILEAETE